MREFGAFVKKEFFHILRDKRTMLIVLVMPVVLIILFGFALSTEVRNVNIGILAPSPDPMARQIADKLAIPLDELRFLNPQYRYDIIPGNIKAYPLVLPLDEINSYALNRDSILAYRPELAKRQVKVDPAGYGSGDVIYYRVKSGDTLGGIALKYRVTVSQLKRWNGIRGTLIRTGQRLRIYR